MRSNVDLRDALLFTFAIVTGVRAREVVNLTWKDITILKGAAAIIVNIRPTKNSRKEESTYSVQIGRRTERQVWPNSVMVVLNRVEHDTTIGKWKTSFLLSQD